MTAEHAVKPVMPTSVDISEYLTTEEVAERLGVSLLTVSNRVARGYLHPLKGCRPDPFGRQRKKKRLLFNPVEVEAEIARVQSLIAAKPGYEGRQRGVPGRSGKVSISLPVEKTADEPADQPAKKVSISLPNNTAVMASGEICAAALKIFEDGGNQLTVIRELKVDFQAAKYFWSCYLEAQPGWFLPPKEFARIRSVLDWTEDPPSVAGFSRAFSRLMNEPSSSNSDTKALSISEDKAIEAALANPVDEEESE